MIAGFKAKDEGCEAERKAIGADHRPGRDKQTITEPEDFAAGQHAIHGEAYAVRHAGAQDHRRLGEIGEGGQYGGDEAEEFYLCHNLWLIAGEEIEKHHCAKRPMQK